MDLRDGNPSLPIILSMSRGDKTVRAAFDCSDPTASQIDAALIAMKNNAAIEEAKLLAKRYARDALKAVNRIPPSKYRNSLNTLVQLIIDRDF
jgi:geranylgeranyl pyrophosphate synthase